MKKIHMIAALMAMLMPTMVFAFGDDFNYVVTANVSKTGTGDGTV